MQPLQHDPAAGGIGGQVVANGAQGLAVGTAALAEAGALLPAGLEEVSVQAALAFALESAETLALNASAQVEMVRTGAAYLQACALYAATDAANATTLL